MPVFVNGKAAQRCKAPLTKAGIPDKGKSSNPIRWNAPPLLMRLSEPDMAYDSRCSYGDVHGYR